MEDKEIINLFWARSEQAIHMAAHKYGKYCHYIAFGILHNAEDSEECVNDTFLAAWDSIPPQKPEKLSAFLGKITRNLALNRWDYYAAEKRGKGQVPLVLEELQECIPAENDVESCVEKLDFADTLNRFLSSLPKEKRMLFMRRYWYLNSIKEISADFHRSESSIKMILLRLRTSFRLFLEKEGVTL